MSINYFSVFLEFINWHFSIDFETINVQKKNRCSFKRKVLIILKIFNILKIHYKHFSLDFLNKYTWVYSEIGFSKNLYQTEAIFAKQINWQLAGFYMIQVFFMIQGTSEQILVLSKILLKLFWHLPNVSPPFELVLTGSKSAIEPL